MRIISIYISLVALIVVLSTYLFWGEKTQGYPEITFKESGDATTSKSFLLREIVEIADYDQFCLGSRLSRGREYRKLGECRVDGSVLALINTKSKACKFYGLNETYPTLTGTADEIECAPLNDDSKIELLNRYGHKKIFIEE